MENPVPWDLLLVSSLLQKSEIIDCIRTLEVTSRKDTLVERHLKSNKARLNNKLHSMHSYQVNRNSIDIIVCLSQWNLIAIKDTSLVVTGVDA
jgi:hypothetical protein